MLKIGDRVSRQIEIGRPERIFGTITRVYKSTQGVGFTPVNLYAIQWDGSSTIVEGYFGEFLQKEE